MFNTQQMRLLLLKYILVSALWKLQLRWHILKFNIKVYIYIYIYILLGSKGLGIYVFRTLIYNIGKPCSKKLVLLKCAQSCLIIVNLKSRDCRCIGAFRSGSIDRRIDLIDRKSIKLRFSAVFQLSPNSLNV